MVSLWDISLYQKKISWWISVQLYPHHESLSWSHREKSRRTKRFSHGLTMRHLIVPKEDLMVNFCPALPPPWEALMVSPWEVLSYQKIISWSQSEISHCIKRRSHGKFMSRPTSTTRGSHGLTVRSLVVPRNFLMASPLDKVAFRKPASWVLLRWSKSFSVLYWKMLYFMVKDAGIMLADRSQLILKRQPLLDFMVTEIPGQVWC